MDLKHSCTVPLPIDQVWTGLLNIEQVATCLPGAAIESVDGDVYNGTVKVKLGPVALTYRGRAEFVERDSVNYRAVIRAQGRDVRGNGTAAARVTATLREDSGLTTVEVHTELDLTGKTVQFGRGVIVDVSDRLFRQFAESLAAALQDGVGQSADSSVVSAGAQIARNPPIPAMSIVTLAGPALVKRVAPILLVLVLLAIAPRRMRRIWRSGRTWRVGRESVVAGHPGGDRAGRLSRGRAGQS